MKLSVITPTEERASLLYQLYTLLKRQTHSHWEWLIYDTSLQPLSFSDPRVRYIHDQDRLSVGEKRNRLIAQATGEVIVHCDDDDYYAPTYLSYVAEALERADFFTLDRWFSFDCRSGHLYYWASDALGQSHFHLDPLSGMRVREIEFGEKMAPQQERLIERGRKGFGFSFAYRASVGKACQFPDLDMTEDIQFFEQVESQPFNILSHADQEGLAIHIIHENNTTADYPQYRIPPFMMQRCLPAFSDFVKTYPHCTKELYEIGES